MMGTGASGVRPRRMGDLPGHGFNRQRSAHFVSDNLDHLMKCQLVFITTIIDLPRRGLGFINRQQHRMGKVGDIAMSG